MMMIRHQSCPHPWLLPFWIQMRRLYSSNVLKNKELNAMPWDERIERHKIVMMMLTTAVIMMTMTTIRF